MPTPRSFNPADFFGYTGRPLPIAPESIPTSDATRQRLKNAGADAFLPYVDPEEVTARAEGYRNLDRGIRVREAEDAFMQESPNFLSGDEDQNRSGFADFLSRHPEGAASPMIHAYQRTRRSVRDPYEDTVAKAGSDYLSAYRAAVQEGQDPTEAFAEFRDIVTTEEAGKKAKEDDELFFVEKGGDLEDFGALQQKGASRAQMLDFINKKGKPITTTEGKRLNELQGFMDDATRRVETPEENQMTKHDEDKVRLFKAKFNREPKTEQDWQDAFFLLKEEKVGPHRQAYDEYISILEEQGKRIPARKGTQAPVDPKQEATPKGMRQAGNTDFFNRPVLDNKDGTTSTASTITVGTPEGTAIIPTVINGKRLTEDEAWQHYKKTGEHFGIFDSVESADAHDKELHRQLAAKPQRSPYDGGAPAVPPKAKPGLSPLEQVRRQMKP